MRQLNINAIPTVAAASPNTSTAIDSRNLFKASAQIVAVGAASAGTLKFQASNDGPEVLDGKNLVPQHWFDISQSVTLATAGTFAIPAFDVCYEWLRVVYTKTGDGTIQVCVKVLGA